MALSEFNFVGGSSELLELPSDERVVEGIFSSSDERSSPISSESKINEILLSFGREEAQPVEGVLKFRDFSLLNTQLHENFVLSQYNLSILVFLVFSSSVFNLTGETDRGSLDGHTSAMETEREKYILSLLSLVTNLIFTLGNGISMSYKK